MGFQRICRRPPPQSSLWISSKLVAQIRTLVTWSKSKRRRQSMLKKRCFRCINYLIKVQWIRLLKAQLRKRCLKEDKMMDTHHRCLSASFLPSVINLHQILRLLIRCILLRRIRVCIRWQPGSPVCSTITSFRKA